MADNEMREPTFLVLAALADGPKHGYALIGEAETLSGGRVRLAVGTLYAALQRLAEQGLVREHGTEVVDGRHRRYHELTDAGAQALEAEAARLEQNAREARVRLGRRSRPASALRADQGGLGSGASRLRVRTAGAAS
ncbi:DNA-binding PadR family transcriptional regulator [Frigoribacterium sp. PhB160]|uniref:PadR family transcriptional regulator n=1 Tax=Frigoribacterium sp. PhB160 TaxID=2485192 RepID=UPI000F480F8E|nr:PadR family transcriptional regulator [Frigoribacterium sp. PhB160]ROS59303.1 DNA-binding PadR family transcriptional regulator [Frigoribacterium sp. PhB160]